MAISDLQFSTDDSNDFIIGLWEGIFVAPRSLSTTQYSFNHGMNFKLLPKGNFSISADYNPSNEITSTISLYGYNIPDVQVSMVGEYNKIVINAYNTTSSSQTIYFRIYAFMPDDVDGDVGSFPMRTAKMLFNSEDNYMKVLSKGHIDISTVSKTITHSLLYVPYVEVWAVTATSVIPMPTVDYPVVGAGVTAIGNMITFYPDTSLGIIRYDYRIYKDD